MKWTSLGTVTLIAVAGFSAALGQGPPIGGGPREARGISADWRASGPGQPDPQSPSSGMAAVQRASAAQKYLFIFFWKEKNQPTDAMWKVFEAATGKMADWADVTAVRADDPAEKQLADRYGVGRAPMPLVLALAPNGAVTKAFSARFDENQLRSALVTPCTAKCLKALQDRKLVFLCVQNSASQLNLAAIDGVRDFQADSRFAGFTEIVCLNSGDTHESAFLKELQIDPRVPAPVTVFLAPPGSVIGKFEGPVSKDQLVAKLASAQSGCCPGGKCGPNGCGPKK